MLLNLLDGVLGHSLVDADGLFPTPDYQVAIAALPSLASFMGSVSGWVPFMAFYCSSGEMGVLSFLWTVSTVDVYSPVFKNLTRPLLSSVGKALSICLVICIK